MNNHELQFIAWLKSDKECWKDIQGEILSIRSNYEDPESEYRILDHEYYKDVYASKLKEEMFFNLEDYNPFSEEFMAHVNLDDVCLFLVDSQEHPSLYAGDFREIDRLVELKKKAEASVKKEHGTVIGFYLSANALRNMEVGRG